jgi:hypothetical protein
MKKYLGFIAAAFLLVEGFGVGAAIAESEDKYGAIATGPNDAYAYSYNYDSGAAAEAAALSQCGSDCSVKIWFVNACGAVAKGGEHIGWAWNTDATAAQVNALESCGDSSCEIVTWACTDR